MKSMTSKGLHKNINGKRPTNACCRTFLVILISMSYLVCVMLPPIVGSTQSRVVAKCGRLTVAYALRMYQRVQLLLDDIGTSSLLFLTMINFQCFRPLLG